MRLENWDIILDKHLQDAAWIPFQYGVCDCVIFASDWVFKATGVDPMYEGRGKYTTLRGGALLIKKYRGSYEGIMDYYYNRVDVHRAQRGDIVLAYDNDGSPAFGIVNNGRAFFKGIDTGLATKRIADCRAAWRVI